MRAVTGFLSLVVAAGTTAILFAGCGGSVQQATGGQSGTGGNGGNANGGSQTVTVSSSSSGMTTTVASSSSSSTTSSSSGGDACMQACSHIQTCVGVNLCQMGLNLDCSNPQYQCTADCINALDCSTLNLQSGQACLQKCAPQDAGPIDAGDPCMNACAHVQQCFGFDVCTLLGMQIDCSVPQNVCIADCIYNTSCSTISMQTFQTCQTMCQGGSDGGTTTDGGTPMACQQCATQSCQQQIGACAADQACMGWLGCAGQCTTPACATQCDAQFANAKPLYDALYSCSCLNCQAQCSAIDPCAHAPDGGP